MRRFGVLIMVLALLCAAPVLAEELPWDTILEAVAALNPDGLSENAVFAQAGDWMSVTVTHEGFVAPRLEGIQTYGLVFGLPEGERITWDDVFADGDMAAEQILALIEDISAGNAYAEYNQVTPLPRDSFTVADGVFTVYYPASQLSYVSGRSLGFSFYAYELEGLLADGVPLAPGDAAQADETLAQTLEGGALPGPLAVWPVGTGIAQAAQALGLVDVPDYDESYAIWHFEAPQMRGVSLLSGREDDREESAVSVGIVAGHIDFGGLQTGWATLADCTAALRMPDEQGTEADGRAYLQWQGEYTVRMHFADDILSSVSVFGNAL